jgi:hypothetical protein
MFMLRCACRHVADGAAPGVSTATGEKNLVLDALVQRTIEVQLNARERAEYTRIERRLVEMQNGPRKQHVQIIEQLRRPLSGVTAGLGFRV